MSFNRTEFILTVNINHEAPGKPTRRDRLETVTADSEEIVIFLKENGFLTADQLRSLCD